jgi:hypothetical protein
MYLFLFDLCFVCQVSLPQPVGAHNLKRIAPSFHCKHECVSSGTDETVVDKLTCQFCCLTDGDSQNRGQGLNSRRLRLVLTLVQMFERIFTPYTSGYSTAETPLPEPSRSGPEEDP